MNWIRRRKIIMSKPSKKEYLPSNINEINDTSIKWCHFLLKHFQKPLHDPNRSEKINLDTKLETNTVTMLINTIARNSVYYNDLKFHNQLTSLNVLLYNAWKHPDLLLEFVHAIKQVKLQNKRV